MTTHLAQKLAKAIAWEFKRGADARKLEISLRTHGRPIPDWIAEAPVVNEHDLFYWQAFQDLCTERQVGYSVGPIPWSAARYYAKEYGLDRDEADDFWTIIRAMDLAYLEVVAEEQKREAEQAKNRR